MNWYYADVKRLDEPAALATEENVVNWVLNQVKVSNKKIKFDELMAECIMVNGMSGLVTSTREIYEPQGLGYIPMVIEQSGRGERS